MLSHHSSACPLDCPDACSLEVRVEDGKVTRIDGSTANPLTEGYICAKVRRFAEHLYSPERLLYPAARSGKKGSGQFQRISWEEALERVTARLKEAARQWGAESILPFSYGRSHGVLSHDTTHDGRLFRLGATRAART